MKKFKFSRRKRLTAKLYNAAKARLQRLEHSCRGNPDGQHSRLYAHFCVRVERHQLHDQTAESATIFVLCLLWLPVVFVYLAAAGDGLLTKAQFVGSSAGFFISMCSCVAVVSVFERFMVMPFAALPAGLVGAIFPLGSATVRHFWPDGGTKNRANIWSAPFEAYLLGCLVGTALMVMVAGTGYLLFAYRRRCLLKEAPEVFAFRMIQELLEWTGGSQRAFSSTAKRRWAIRHLEQAAIALEVGFPRALAANPPTVEAFVSAAGHIRAYQQWITTPQPQTQRHLHDELSSILAALASGHYDLLPRSAELTRQPTKPLRQRIADGSRTVLIGLFPIGSLIGLEALHVDIDSTVRTTWFAWGLIWAFLTYVGGDPLALGKIATTQEIFAIFRRKSD